MPEEIQDFQQLPPDWWRKPNAPQVLSHVFGKHILGLHLMGQVKGDVQHAIYTGLILYHQDRLMWITAGHVIDEITQLLAASTNFKLISASWLDGCTIPNAQGIPAVGIEQSLSFSATHESMQKYGEGFDIDFGVMALNDVEWAIAHSGHSIPITEQAWLGHETAKPEGHYLVGFPREWMKIEQAESADSISFNISTSLACVPVSLMVPPEGHGEHETYFWSHPDCIYAEIPKAEELTPALEQIQGTSGGPIFSIERTAENRLKYRLIGIQSAWLPSKRILRAVSIKTVAAILRVNAGVNMQEISRFENA